MRKNFVEDWQKYPFLGLTLPLIAGIVTAEYVDFLIMKEVIYILLFVLLLLLAYFIPKTSYSHRYLFGLLLYVFLFIAGGAVRGLQIQALQFKLPEHSRLYQAVLLTNPSVKIRSVQCEAYLVSCMDSLSKESVGQYAMLTFANDSTAKALFVGDTVYYYYSITAPPKSNSNPGVFDYANYLRRQGINAVAYVPSFGRVNIKNTRLNIGDDCELPLSVRCLLAFRKCRNHLLATFHRENAEAETVAALSALTLGDVSGLSKQLKDDYSVAGASHILALSGSHLAVIYAILEMFFSLCLYRWRAGRIIGKLSIVVLIWGFTLLAGSQPSLIRAAVTYTLLVSASFFSRKTLSLNSLAVAAFFMLLVDPASLYDVGFQLSFLAVLGIIVFQDKLYTPLRTPYKIVNYMVSVITVSVSVQLIAFPLILYYFSSFPLYFLLTNLLVVPVSSLVLLIAIVSFPIQYLFPGSAIGNWIVESLYYLVKLQNEGVKWIASLSHASLYIPGVTKWTLIWMYVMLLFLLFKKYLRPLSRWYVGLATLLAGVCIIVFTWFGRRNNAYLVFYDNRRCPAVHVVKGNRPGVLFPAWKDSVSNGLSYLAEAAWKPAAIPYPAITTPEDGILMMPECSVLLLNDYRWIRQRLKERIRVDYVWICRGFYGDLSKALASFSIRTVVLDSSLSEMYRQIYRRECERLQIPFHDITEKGALKVDLGREA